MLTRLTVRNFKALGDVEIELGQNVVLIGQNNSGKTTALQALSLWQSGLREWLARRSRTEARERTGVTLNRRSLTHTPVRDSRYLWRNLKLSQQGQEARNGAGKVFIEVIVEGQRSDGAWRCGLEFYYANAESIYCRPIRQDDHGPAPAGPDVPEAAKDVRIAFLPPMSGLVTEEPELQPGRLDVLIGEGQTAQVLRNLCLQVAQRSADDWRRIVQDMERMFRLRLATPERDPVRGEVELRYVQDGCELDLSSVGRGAQQVLLLLAHLRLNQNSVLLLDEPDAHLEILRQRSVYSLLTEAAQETRSQIIAASHSEVILTEASDKDVVVAFIGKPHRVDDRRAQVLKALRDIGAEHYYQAERKGWVLYLEGPTDLAILQAWAKRLGHPVFDALVEPFVHYVGNQTRAVLHHFHGLREAKPNLKAFALLDRLAPGRLMPTDFNLPHHVWSKREIENYLAQPSVLLRYAEGEEGDDLVGRAVRARRAEAMDHAIARVVEGFRLTRRDAWSPDVKASEELLPAIFETYHEILGVPDKTDKSDFHVLAGVMLPDEIDPEIRGVLDAMQHALIGSP